MIMDNKILVAYATKYGATEGIARRIGQRLEESGFEVDLLPAGEINDLEQYPVVVLGSAVYAGQWLKEAAGFLTQNEAVLSQKRVWFFSSGPTGEGDPVEAMKGWTFPENLRASADRVAPEDIAFLMGEINMDKLKLPEKLIIKALKAPTGDYRDWDAIDEWASSIVKRIHSDL
jgi:menaquinone-dependent protoporphyrinogen oxidase